MLPVVIPWGGRVGSVGSVEGGSLVDVECTTVVVEVDEVATKIRSRSNKMVTYDLYANRHTCVTR